MDAAGIIFSNIHDSALPELTRVRTMASVPYAGRYRFVDFSLSNMVNSGITTVGIITKNNYQSLMDHVGTGKEWDLARKGGGLRIIPPYGVKDSSFYTSRLEALKGSMSYLNRAHGEYVVLSDSDNICNISFEDVLKFHKEHNADITFVYRKCVRDVYSAKNSVQFELDGERLTGIVTDSVAQGEANVSMNMWVMRKEMLRNMVQDAISHGFTSFSRDIIRPSIGKVRIYGYEFKGYYGDMDSLQHYYRYSMDLLHKDVRDELFEKRNRAVYTKVKDSAPTKYGAGAVVKNSLISDGCIIDGVVENSILSRGVRVSKNAVVKNCILFQDTTIGRRCSLNTVITDKNVVIRDSRTLAGCEEQPFFVDKGRVL